MSRQDHVQIVAERFTHYESRRPEVATPKGCTTHGPFSEAEAEEVVQTLTGQFEQEGYRLCERSGAFWLDRQPVCHERITLRIEPVAERASADLEPERLALALA